MSDEFKLELDGADALKALANELPKRIVEKGLRQAATAATTPIARAYRKNVPVRSGTMKKAVKKKVKLYRANEVAIGIVGIDKSAVSTYQGRTVRPAKYQHLVELGTKPHTIQRGNIVITNPGSPPQQPLARAEKAEGPNALAIASAKLKDVLEKEAATLAANGKT